MDHGNKCSDGKLGNVKKFVDKALAFILLQDLTSQRPMENRISSVYGASLFYKRSEVFSFTFPYRPSTDDLAEHLNVYHLLGTMNDNTTYGSTYCRITQTGSETSTVTSA
jgi:hypothetical protein